MPSSTRCLFGPAIHQLQWLCHQCGASAGLSQFDASCCFITHNCTAHKHITALPHQQMQADAYDMYIALVMVGAGRIIGGS